MAKDSKLNLETTLAKLEATIEKLDEEQLSVEDSLSAFEAGLKLVRKAQKDLQDAEQRVMALVEEGGEPSEKVFLDSDPE